MGEIGEGDGRIIMTWRYGPTGSRDLLEHTGLCVVIIVLPRASLEWARMGLCLACLRLEISHNLFLSCHAVKELHFESKLGGHISPSH